MLAILQMFKITFLKSSSNPIRISIYFSVSCFSSIRLPGADRGISPPSHGLRAKPRLGRSKLLRAGARIEGCPVVAPSIPGRSPVDGRHCPTSWRRRANHSAEAFEKVRGEWTVPGGGPLNRWAPPQKLFEVIKLETIDFRHMLDRLNLFEMTMRDKLCRRLMVTIVRKLLGNSWLRHVTGPWHILLEY